jgi:hypothetical protein
MGMGYHFSEEWTLFISKQRSITSGTYGLLQLRILYGIYSIVKIAHSEETKTT